jgi:peroxiredoxin
LSKRKAAAAVAAAVIAVALAVTFIFVARSRPASPIKAGAAAPDFDLVALGYEGRVRLAELKGRPIVLGLIDTRWPEFLDAVEGLERTNRALRGRGLAVVGVFLDRDPAAALEFIGAHPVTFTPAHDPDGTATGPRYGRPRASELVVIDSAGKIVARSLDVAAWRTAPFRKTIEPLLEPEKPGT